MPKESEFWHKTDVQDEVLEYHEAKGFFPTWSEISDVVYTHTRAKWTGYTHFRFPLHWYHYPIGLVYMYPKYTLRWLFFRKVGKIFGKHGMIHEVRNPRKIEKLQVLAEKYQIDKEKFVEECKKLLQWWPLLK
jgi:hypothetical protein